MKPVIIIIVAAFLSSSTINAQQSKTNNIKQLFNQHNLDGCFVLYNQKLDSTFIYNNDLANTGYLPASTFKIPHAVIALQEGLVKDINDTIKWNGHEWPHKVWNQDQTLATSLKYSCIWVYFGFAEQLGIDKYYTYVNNFDYGNKNLDGPPTRFWLAGEFKITAVEQVEFLKRFYTHNLPVKPTNIEQVKSAVLLEKTNAYKYYGKTGGTDIKEGEHIMWLVGFVETQDNVFIYALNFIAPNFANYTKLRYDITKAILKEMEVF